MSKTDDETREELFEEFLEESEELIGEMERYSIALEANPDDMESIHGIFRAAHSLKGNSSFFGLTQVQTFCHQFENFLDLIREKVIEINQEQVYFILDGADFLKDIAGRLRLEGIDVALKEDETLFLDKVSEKIGDYSGEGRLDDLRDELIEYFKRTEGALGDKDSPVKEIHELIKRFAPDLLIEKQEDPDSSSGASWFYDDLNVTDEIAQIKTLLEEADVTTDVDDGYNRFMEAINSLLAKHLSAEIEKPVEMLTGLKDDFDIFYNEELGFDEMLVISIHDTLESYKKSGLVEIQPEKESIDKDAAREKSVAIVDKETSVKSKTIRINEALLDDLIEHVGELVTTNELFNNIQRKLDEHALDSLSNDMKNINQAFGELSTQLQKVLYEIRKAPIERAYSKMPAIIRGIAKKSEKEIRFEAIGGDTEVDKSLLDQIETIMGHCVRNSCDHGIELPEERIKKGKTAHGAIAISAKAHGNKVSLLLEDDGRGADIEKIRDKAVEKGFVSQEAALKLSERETLEYLLLPGFSTAGQVTETSGRGVGMDVLKSSVREMGGDLSLVNKNTGGLQIEITLPLAYTTRIKLGLTLGVGSNIFLVPAENVRETFKADGKDVNRVEGKGEVVRRWDSIYPVIRLHKMFGIKPDFQEIEDGILTLVESKGTTACLLVDEIIGQRQIVYKELNVKTTEPTAFEGISVLDGQNMALILSVEGVIKQFQGKTE